MKKIIMVLIFLVGFSQINAQFQFNRFQHGKNIQKLEQVKLVEVLDLDEDTAVKFFTRKKHHQEIQEKLTVKIDVLYEKLTKKMDNNDKVDFDKARKEILSLEKEGFQNRENFINSLSDLLSQEQIVKMLVFEKQFREEIAKYMMKNRRGQGNPGE
jgi:hypothetical protein